MNTDTTRQMSAWAQLIESAMMRQLDTMARRERFSIPPQLHEAMRYSLVGGKRLRGVLALAGAQLMDVDADLTLPFAGAAEMIHAYSLIHDDLPAMDNDDLRRGRPTNHKVFGEAMAILAGDALLNTALEWMLESDAGFLGYEATRWLARAAGAGGMVAGQTLDLAAEGQPVTLAELQRIHRSKTGALIEGSFMAGISLGTPSTQQAQSAARFGQALGLAFQISDDILDCTSTTEAMGKTVGKDALVEKATYPRIVGLQRSYELAREATEEAIAALACFGQKAAFLIDLANSMLTRDH